MSNFPIYHLTRLELDRPPSKVKVGRTVVVPRRAKEQIHYDYEQYLYKPEASIIAKEQIHYDYEQYLYKPEASIITDTSNFGIFVNSKKNSSRIPGKMFYNESELEDPQEIVEAFSRHFSSVYQDSAYVNFVDSVCSNSLSFNISAMNDEDILQSMKRLLNKMTAGNRIIGEEELPGQYARYYRRRGTSGPICKQFPDGEPSYTKLIMNCR
ncbi:hypothetical protein QE152_g37368 [Popillia japonica]|uniref:Uncharacterized protein n=1 Tax=Popillia japonica TaxID=7064 RepID=A0AAW1IAC5_POPJA